MSAIPAKEQRLAAFRSACKRAVARRDPDGHIPAKTSIPLAYRDLIDRAERREVRTWLAQQQHAAIARCDMQASRAWGEVRDRVNRYDHLLREPSYPPSYGERPSGGFQ